MIINFVAKRVNSIHRLPLKFECRTVQPGEYAIMPRSRRLSLCLIAGSLAAAGCTLVEQPIVRPQATYDRSVIPKELPPVADAATYRQMLSSARKWQRKAQSVNGEWRDVESLLDQAERAASAGDYRNAIELAEFARFQAEMGYRQMRAQEIVDNPPFLYY